MIPLAILCAVLVAVIAAMVRGVVMMRSMFRAAREWMQAKADAREVLIAEGYALLHDERHKGREDNQKAWQKARDEWAAKVKGVGK